MHEEAWPKLKVSINVHSICTQHSIDVYAEAGGHEAVHTEQRFKIDTST